MLFSSFLVGKLHCCCKTVPRNATVSGALASGATCDITETNRVFDTIQSVAIKQKNSDFVDVPQSKQNKAFQINLIGNNS